MHSNKSYFIFGFGAGKHMNHYEIGAHIGTAQKEKGNLFSVIFFILHGKTINLE